MSQIDEVLQFINDGEWYSLDEIAQVLKINPQKLDIMIDLLKEFDFIQLENNKVRILADIRKLMKKRGKKAT